MTTPRNPHRDPEALDRAEHALQSAATRLLAHGVPLEDIAALADTAREYAAAHVADRLTRAGAATAATLTYQGQFSALAKVRDVAFPLAPAAGEQPTTHRPARPSLATPCARPECHRHPYNWHVPGPRCAVTASDGTPCPCPGYVQPAPEERP